MEGKSIYFITNSETGEIISYKKQNFGCLIVNVNDGDLLSAIRSSLDYEIPDFTYEVVRNRSKGRFPCARRL